MKLKKLVRSLALIGVGAHLVTTAVAQSSDAVQKIERVEITGSSIKRFAKEGALPVQVITANDLKAQGITTADQLISSLSSNGNGMDNLASNADVGAGSGRGNNGLSAANLRGQGSAATLVLLNGRRVASGGLNGGVVDLNSIPMAALDRIEILKDGASAIYGTDAIGGVINFILKKNYRGLELSAFTDITQDGGGNINRFSLTGGAGDLDRDKYNVLFSITHSDSQALRADQRGFVNTFQPDRGLSVDTRGTPYATVFAINSLNSGLSLNNLSAANRGTGPKLPGGTQVFNGINPLDLPGGAGCASVPGMAAYDNALWASPAAAFGCAVDTGRMSVLQQPLKNTNLVARGTLALGEHQLFAEFNASQSDSAKSFSASQVSSSTSTTSPFYNLAYPSSGAAYNSVFSQLVSAFPQLSANAGLPLAFRWRCVACGPREIDTTSKASRFLLGADGPLPFLNAWDYRAGVSTASSEASSVLGGGYYFSTPFAALLNTGVLNPFLLAGQTQTAAAMSALQAASANGVTLYGGKSTLVQADATATGPLFKLPAGDVMAAVGVDMRTEKFNFNGNATALATQTAIFNAPFDSVNSLNTVQRDVKAVFTEVLVPITQRLEATLAVRHDEYTGFGGTTNPKVSFRYTPVDELLTRGSYSTGFRVPTFAQQFFGVTESPYTGAGVVDPAKCPALVVSTTAGSPCTAITFDTLFGGKATLKPEESKQGTLGFVWAPNSQFSLGADWWSINRTGTIQAANLTTLLKNYALFPQNFVRDATGNITLIDTSWINAGETVTRGVDINISANGRLADGRWAVLLDGSYLIEKKSRLIASAPFGGNEVGQFNLGSDPSLRWKHSLTGTYAKGDWTGTLTQQFRSGYIQALLPGVANGSVKPVNWNPKVSEYFLYNASISYTGFKNLGLTVGIKNLFNTDPPFAITYDTNTGAGSSWDPRVADPRGRALTMLATYQFN